MNKYWSNDDDKKVSYITEQPMRSARVNGGAPQTAQEASRQYADADSTGVFSAAQGLNRPEAQAYRPAPPAGQPNYGLDRSTFLSQDQNVQPRPELQFAPPPKFTAQGPQPGLSQQPYPFEEGYQVRSEIPQGPRGGRHGRRGFFIFLIVFLLLLVIGLGTYIFRYHVLELIGNVFGDEAVWLFSPTPAPAQPEPDVPAYVESTPETVKARVRQEIEAVAGGLALETYAVTQSSIIASTDNPDGTSDYYLFAADNGRLLGYYAGLRELIPCSDDIFYLGVEPYLITAEGFPLTDLTAYARTTGGSVTLSPMLHGWALVIGAQGELFNYIGADGELISDLWFAKAFPFTADTTFAYLDTGNTADPENRYALYLLNADGETKRISFAPDMEGMLQSVCGVAFMENGEMRTQTANMALIGNTDRVTAYGNCGALVVRDRETQLYGLFVDGVQQYPYAFDSIEVMSSDLSWVEDTSGFVTRRTVDNQAYPLPRSYSFVLKQGDTAQFVSIAAVSQFPMPLD